MHIRQQIIINLLHDYTSHLFNNNDINETDMHGCRMIPYNEHNCRYIHIITLHVRVMCNHT